MHVVLLLQTLLSLSKLALLASDENNDAELEGKCQPTIVYELHFSLACGEPGLPLLAVFLAAFLFAPSTIACSQASQASQASQIRVQRAYYVYDF